MVDLSSSLCKFVQKNPMGFESQTWRWHEVSSKIAQADHDDEKCVHTIPTVFSGTSPKYQEFGISRGPKNDKKCLITFRKALPSHM